MQRGIAPQLRVHAAALNIEIVGGPSVTRSARSLPAPANTSAESVSG